MSGRVDGNIEAKGVLRILSTAQLYGDILVQSLISDEGSIFEGNCKMVSAFKCAKFRRQCFKKQ